MELFGYNSKRFFFSLVYEYDANVDLREEDNSLGDRGILGYPGSRLVGNLENNRLIY